MLRHLIILFSLSDVLSELINKHQGSKCEWKSATGTCVNIFKCQSAMDFLKTRDYPPICTFQGKEPVVCCTDCTFVDDIRKMVFNSHAGMLYLTGQKAHDKCVNFIDKLDYECKLHQTAAITRTLDTIKNCNSIGENHTGFIEPWESPRPTSSQSYMALLGYGKDMKSAQWLCAGAIISEKFILTAAHCLNDDKLGLVQFVALGIVKRTDPVDMWQKHSVKRSTPHPKYNPPSKYHDIALLEIGTTITFTNKVLPACILSENEKFGITKAHTVIWDSEGEEQGTLKLATISYFDDIQCSFFYPPNENLANGFNGTTQLCRGDTGKPKDSCQSDSGGPLLVDFQEAGCAPIIIGVTSLDRTCGSFGSSGLYTKVSHYVPWIESIVWP